MRYLHVLPHSFPTRRSSDLEMDVALRVLTDPQKIATVGLAKAFIQLLIGDLVGGFDAYEVRFDPTLESTVRFTEFGRRWEVGDDLRDRKVTRLTSSQ